MMKQVSQLRGGNPLLFSSRLGSLLTGPNTPAAFSRVTEQRVGRAQKEGTEGMERNTGLCGRKERA